jgi:tRNA(Arg) A34 adenosine deaminase TadA
METRLDPPMERALTLAWEAYCAGSFPVGCVIADADGAVVAEGRNRVGDAEAPPGRMRSTAIAHAEIDALSQLPMGDYSQFTLYSSLEPCLLCRSATLLSRIGTVRFLADDRLWDGLDRLPELNEQIERTHPEWDGPGVGAAALFAGVLPMAVQLLFSKNPDTIERCERAMPERVAAARRLIAQDRWPSRDLDLYAAIEFVRPVFAP